MTRRARGRPAATDSADTHAAIIDAARLSFASEGFDGASLSAIARDVGLAPSALYHYVDDKRDLFEQVATATVETVWGRLLEVVGRGGDFATQLDRYMSAVVRVSRPDRGSSAFLLSLPIEARRHPEFQPLVMLVRLRQRQVFDCMARRGVESGDIVAFGDDTVRATERGSAALQMLLLGWSYQSHYTPEHREQLGVIVRASIDGWCRR